MSELGSSLELWYGKLAAHTVCFQLDGFPQRHGKHMSGKQRGRTKSTKTKIWRNTGSFYSQCNADFTYNSGACVKKKKKSCCSTKQTNKKKNTLTFKTAISIVLLLIKVHLLWRNCFNLKLWIHPTPVFYHHLRAGTEEKWIIYPSALPNRLSQDETAIWMSSKRRRE